MGSVETLGVYRSAHDPPSVAVSLWGEGKLDRDLRYFSVRFGLYRDEEGGRLGACAAPVPF